MPSKGDPHPGSGAGHDAAVGTVLGAVNELLPGIGERAAQAESDRRLPDSTVKELTDTGVMRLLKPKAFGGYEADPVAFYEAVLSIAEHCGSTAWVTGVVGVHNWQLALFESKLQHEIWDENPDAWVSSSYMPGGKLTAVPGGFELTGRWSFSSGSDHCQWAILGALQMNEDGPPTTYNVVIPRTDYVVEDVWHTVGLRGTGSNDIVIDGAFVPSHRALTKTQVYSNDAPGRESNTAALYGMPFATMFPSVITAPVVGMAQGLLDIAIDYQSKRVSRAHGKMLDADPYSVAALGAAASTIDACRRQLLGNISGIHKTLAGGGLPTMDQRSTTRRDQVLGTVRCVSAIDDVFDRAGAVVISDTHPMQRIWRDAHAAKHHTVNTNERTLHSWAHNAMGLGPSESVV